MRAAVVQKTLFETLPLVFFQRRYQCPEFRIDLNPGYAGLSHAVPPPLR
jgi:hypothetical protein